MADFTVEGIIDVDASRGIRGVRKFKNELKTLLADLRAVSREIDAVSRKDIDVKINADRKELDELKASLKTLNDEKVKVDLDADTTQALIQVSRFVEMIDGLTATIHIHADTDQALIDAIKIKEEIDRMKATIKVDADKSGIGKGGGALGGLGGILGGAGTAAMIAAIVALVSALGPLTAALAAVGAAGLGGLGIMGVGFASLGAFAIPTLKDIGEGLKLLNTDTSKLSPEKLKEYNKQLREFKKTNPEIWKLSQNFQKLKESYMGFANQIKPDVIRAAGHAIGFLNELVKQTGPIAVAAAPAFADLIKSMKIGVAGDEWTAFFTYVKNEIPNFIAGFGEFMGNILTGVANLAVALDPVTKMVGNGFLKMSEDFRAWSQTLESNKGFQKFLDYMVEMGPKVWDAVVAISKALGNLLINLAPLGEKVLAFVTGIADWYNKLSETNPELAEMVTNVGALTLILAPFSGIIGSVLAPFGALLGMMKGGAIFGWLKSLGSGLGSAGAGGTAAAGGISAGVAAIAALVAILAGIGVVLALTTDTGANYNDMWKKLKELWANLKETGKEIWENLKKIWEWVEKSKAIEQYQQAVGKMADTFKNLLPLIKAVAIIVGAALVGAFIALGYALNIVMTGIEALSWIVKVVVDAIVAAFTWLYDVLVGHSIIPDLITAIIEWFTGLPGALLGLIGDMVAGIVGFFGGLAVQALEKVVQFKEWITGKFGELKGNVLTKIQELKDGAAAKFTALKTAITNIVTGIPGWLGERFTAAKTAVLNKIQELKDSASEKFRAIIQAAKDILGKAKDAVTGAFSGAGRWLLDVGKSIMQGLLDGVEWGIDKLQGLLESATDLIPDWKGPENRDKTLLTPSGVWIMEGLIEGIKSQKNYLRSELGGITDAVAATQFNFFGDGAASAESASATATGIGYGGGGMVVNHNYLEVKVALGTNLAAAGREIAEALEAYNGGGGRR